MFRFQILITCATIPYICILCCRMILCYIDWCHYKVRFLQWEAEISPLLDIVYVTRFALKGSYTHFYFLQFMSCPEGSQINTSPQDLTLSA